MGPMEPARRPRRAPADDALSMVEAAEEAGVTVRVIANALGLDELPSVEVQKGDTAFVRISRADLARWCEQQGLPARNPPLE